MIIGVGRRTNIHIFVFTDLKNNRFQQKLIMQNTNYRSSYATAYDVIVDYYSHFEFTHKQIDTSRICLSAHKTIA